MTLDELPRGRLARVTQAARPQGGATLRLMEMGLVRGARVELRKRAPLGGPLELKVEGYLLTVRRRDARAFTVELLEAEAEPPTAQPGSAPEAA